MYLVTVEDLTCNCAQIKRDVTTATRYIVDVSLKPVEAMPHVFKWSVVTARKAGETYEAAGATSEERTFTWTGIGAPAASPTPSP